MIHEHYTQWLATTNDRQKLQTIYAIIAIGALVVAGLFSLLDHELGLRILNVAYLAAVVWLVNFVAWALFLALSQREPANTKPAAKK